MISTSSQAESRHNRFAGQRLLTCLYAGLHADHVADFVFHAPVEVNEEINCARLQARHSSQEFRYSRFRRLGFEIRAQFARHCSVIRKRTLFSVRLEEEVERIEGAYFGDQIDFHGKFRSRLREHYSREVVAFVGPAANS